MSANAGCLVPLEVLNIHIWIFFLLPSKTVRKWSFLKKYNELFLFCCTIFDKFFQTLDLSVVLPFKSITTDAHSANLYLGMKKCAQNVTKLSNIVPLNVTKHTNAPNLCLLCTHFKKKVWLIFKHVPSLSFFVCFWEQ